MSKVPFVNVPFASYEIVEGGVTSPSRVMSRVSSQDDLISEYQFFYAQGFIFGPFDSRGGRRHRLASVGIGISV